MKPPEVRFLPLMFTLNLLWFFILDQKVHVNDLSELIYSILNLELVDVVCEQSVMSK